MTDQEKLYETFGELIYVVAMADGIIQPEEETALHEILNSHPWAKEIEWSFKYEKNKQNSVEDVYKKVIDFCHHFGPHMVYQEMIDVISKIAEASNGIDSEEKDQIDSFSKDLTARFQRDLDKLKN